MSKPSARKPTVITSGYETSIARTAIAALLVVLGIAWIAVYINLRQDAADYTSPGGKKPGNPLPWMADLGKWNFADRLRADLRRARRLGPQADPARPRPRRGRSGCWAAS